MSSRGREILAEVAFEEATHEFLKGHALGVEFGAVKRDALQVLHALRQDGRIDVDRIGEDVRLGCFLRVIES